MLGLKQQTLIGEIDHDKSDGRSGLTYGNGTRTTTTYDASGRVTAIDNTRTLALQYAYNDQGQITGIDLNGSLQTYWYDPQGRLTQADTNLGRYAYAYDPVGNRTRKEHTDSRGSSRTDYRYAAEGEGNRLTGQTAAGRDEPFIYNASGSPVQAGDLSYTYNPQQRPVNVYKAGPGADQKQLLATYTYNRFGERIKKVVYDGQRCTRAAGTGCAGAASITAVPRVTYYLYDGHRLTAEANGQGKITAQYLYEQGRPVAKLEGRDVYALHTDHLGTPRAATDEQGNVVWRADYSPFGQARITTEKIALNLRLPGQYFDQETNKYYNYFRDYDPGTGRYATSDPIGLKGGLNTYAYVSGNPLGMTDVLGLAANGGGRLTLPPDGGFPDTWLNNANQYGYDVGEVMDGLIAVPKPVADSAYLQKVDAVLTEAIFQLSNNPDYGGDAALVAFAEQLRQDAPWIMGGLAGIMALSALPPPVGVTLSTSLVVAGVTMVGLDGILFLSDLVDTLGAVSSIPGCDGAALQKQGEELARRIFDVGLEVAEGAIIGTLGAVGKIANKVKTLNSDAAKKVSDGLSKEVSGNSLDELVEDVGRNIGVPRGLAVPKNLPKNIHPGQQGKHIPTDNNFIPGRSTINGDIDPQKLLDGVHSGQYPVVGTGSRGQPIVDFGRPIGVDSGSGLSTQYGTIHSGKNGAHIVPTNPIIVRRTK